MSKVQKQQLRNTTERKNSKAQLNRDPKIAAKELAVREIGSLPPSRKVYEKRGALFYLENRKDVRERLRSSIAKMKTSTPES